MELPCSLLDKGLGSLQISYISRTTMQGARLTCEYATMLCIGTSYPTFDERLPVLIPNLRSIWLVPAADSGDHRRAHYHLNNSKLSAN